MKKPFDRAAWIWNVAEPVWNETVDLLAAFTVADPAACRIYVSANSHYALYVNGVFVNCDQFPDYDTWKAYDELPLADFVIPGENSLCLTAYWQGDESLTYRPFPAGAAFAVYEGETLLTASGPDTLARRNTRYAVEGVEKITGQLSYSFRYDATAELPEARPARVLDYSWPLHARPIKKLAIDAPETVTVCAEGRFTESASAKKQPTVARRMQAAAVCALAPNEVRPALPDENGLPLKDNFIILDLGREQVGFFMLDIDLPEACDVFIGWGEHLEDLRVRTTVGGRNFAALYRGHAGRNTFFYPIKRMGLRYVQLHVFCKGAKLYYAGVRVSRYPVDTVTLFDCADHLHSRIYRTSLRTLQHCMHDHYEDCPWREQALYTMDSRNQMLCGYYTFDEYAFPRASLRMFALNLRADHTLELTSPGKTGITIPSFTAIYLIQLGEYLRCSDDEELLREVLPAATDIADGFLARMEKGGLIRRFEGERYWNFYEGQEGLAGICGAEKSGDQQAYDAPLMAFVSMGLEQMCFICDRLGHPELSARYAAARKEINAAINTCFWQPEKGYYATTLENGELRHACELTQSLAVCCGAVPRGRLEQVLETLTGNMGPDFYPVTLSHSVFKYEALLRLPARYARFVFDQIADIFGAMLYKDATTFWETSDGASAFDNAGSLCHAWSAIPAYLYLRYIADSRGEGGALPGTLTGIYEPRLRRFADASRRITDDCWPK